MLISYLGFSTLISLFFCFVWTNKNWTNAIIKMVFIAWFMWSAFLLAAAVWPMVNNGAIHLFL